MTLPSETLAVQYGGHVTCTALGDDAPALHPRAANGDAHYLRLVAPGRTASDGISNTPEDLGGLGIALSPVADAHAMYAFNSWLYDRLRQDLARAWLLPANATVDGARGAAPRPLTFGDQVTADDTVALALRDEVAAVAGPAAWQNRRFVESLWQQLDDVRAYAAGGAVRVSVKEPDVRARTATHYDSALAAALRDEVNSDDRVRTRYAAAAFCARHLDLYVPAELVAPTLLDWGEPSTFPDTGWCGVSGTVPGKTAAARRRMMQGTLEPVRWPHDEPDLYILDAGFADDRANDRICFAHLRAPDLSAATRMAERLIAHYNLYAPEFCATDSSADSNAHLLATLPDVAPAPQGVPRQTPFTVAAEDAELSL